MSPWRLIAEGLGQRVDADLIPTLYAAASVPSSELREELRAGGHAFVDAEAGLQPDADELARTVEAVIKLSERKAGAVGVLSGAVGAAGIAPEALAGLVHSLRLAQRLAIVYGFDPETDAGKLLISRALASAYDVSLPDSTRVATRVSELPDVVRRQMPAARAAATWLGQQVAARSASALMGRFVKMVPGLGAGIGGYTAMRRQRRLADRMCAVYQRAMEGLPFDLSNESLAVEVPGPQ